MKWTSWATRWFFRSTVGYYPKGPILQDTETDCTGGELDRFSIFNAPLCARWVLKLITFPRMTQQFAYRIWSFSYLDSGYQISLCGCTNLTIMEQQRINCMLMRSVSMNMVSNMLQLMVNIMSNNDWIYAKDLEMAPNSNRSVFVRNIVIDLGFSWDGHHKGPAKF